MTCRELVRLLADHFAGALAPEVSVVLAAHASECSCCRALVETYGVTIELGRSIPDTPVPEGVSRRVRAALRAEAGFPAGPSETR